jgi:hypothetical protein
LNRIRTDQKQENIRFFDPPQDFLLELLSLGMPFQSIHGSRLPFVKALMNLFGNDQILAGVGDEDMGHNAHLHWSPTFPTLYLMGSGLLHSMAR